MPDPTATPVPLLKKLQEDTTARFALLEKQRQQPVAVAPAAQQVAGQKPLENLSAIDRAKIAIYGGSRLTQTISRYVPPIRPVAEAIRRIAREPEVAPTRATLAESSITQRLIVAQQAQDIELGRLNWRQNILNVVPNAVVKDESGNLGLKYKSVTDILNSFGSADLDDTDIQFASQVLLESKRNLGPEVPLYDSKARQEIVAQLTRSQSVSTYGIAISAQQDFLGLLAALQRPKLPDNMPLEDFYAVLAATGWTDAEIEDKLSKETWVREQEQSWATWQARDDVRRSSYASMELSDIAKAIQAEKIKVLTTPSLAGLFIPFEYYSQILEGYSSGPFNESIATLKTSDVGTFLGLNTAGDRDFLNKLTIARGMGLSQYEEYVYAMENWNTNALYKFLMQSIPDPLNLVGFGVTSTILRKVPLVGARLAGLNTGFIRATDSAFLGIKAGLTHLGGKTTEIAVSELTKGLNDGLIAAIEKANSAKYKSVREMPVGLVRDESRRLAKYHLYRPSDTTEGSFGAGILMQEPVKMATAREWASRLGLELDEAAFVLDYKILDLDNLLGQIKGLGGAQLSGAAPLEQFLRVFGAEITDANLKTAATIFEELSTGITKQIDNLTSGKSTMLILNRISKNVQDVFKATLDSDVAALRTKYISLTGWEVFADSFTKASLTHSLSNMSRTTARWYLLMSAYGIMNVAEAAAKTALAELNPFFKGDLLLQSERELAGLIGLPESVKAVAFIKELGPMEGMRSNAQRTIVMKREESSVNAWRRLLRETVSADTGRMITDIPQTIFIKIGARLGAQQNLNFILQSYHRALVEANPELMLLVPKYPKQYKSVLTSAGFSPKMAEQVVDESMMRITADYRQLDSLHLDWTPDTIAANHLEKLLAPYASIGPYVSDALRTEIQTGRLMPQLSQIFGDPSTGVKGWVHEMVYNDILSQPELVGREIQSMVSEILDHPAQTLEAFQHQMVTLNEIVSTVSATVDTQLEMGQHIGVTIVNKTKKGEHFETLIEGRLAPFLEASRNNINRIVAEMKTHLSAVPVENRQAYDNLLDKYLRHAATYTDIRERQFAFERVMKAEFGGNTPSPRHPRANAWWDEFISGRSEIWDKERTNLAQESAGIETDAYLLGGGVLPHPFRAIAGQITPADIARLYGIRTQDVRPGLYRPEANVFISKEAWVTKIYDRAKRVAAKGSETPEQLGFGRDLLGNLYERLRAELKTGEPVQNLADPAFAQLAKFREDIEYYATTRGAEFTPEMSQALQDYGKAVKAGIESDSQLGILTGKTLKVEEGYDWGGTQFHSSITSEIRQKLNELASSLPAGTKLDINRIMISPRITRRGVQGAFSARFIESEKILQLSPHFTPEDFYHEVGHSMGLDEAASEKFARSAGEVFRKGTKPVVPSVDMTAWNIERQNALDQAVKEYYLNFPDYDHATALNTSIKTFMPFFTYEAHRPFYLARTFIEKPGTYLSMGRYKDNTDQGYFRLPGLQNVQANMFRGSIWGIVAGRNLQVDYPEYYDQYPGWSNAVNNLERNGFFFAPTLTLSASLAGVLAPKRGKIQTGEAVPPVLGSVLEIFIAAFPESGAAKSLQETIMSSRFRDRYIAIMVSQQGGDGDGLLDKRRLDIKLDPEEQQQWDSASASTARFGLFSIQAGMVRMKPEELIAFQELAKQTLADATGVPVAMQNEMAKYGLRIGDQFPISPEVSDLVDALEGASQWRGLSKGLGPSEASYVLQLTAQYYREIEDKRLLVQSQKLSFDARFRLPASNPDHVDRRTWEDETQALDTSVFEFGKQLKLSGIYKEALVTRKEREDFALKHNQPLLLQHPEYELLSDYFDIHPELKFDPEANITQRDFSGFYRRRRLTVETLSEPQRGLFESRINKYDSPLETIRRLDYEYMQPYFDAREFIKSTLPTESRKLIAQYEATSDPQVRTALRAELDKTAPAGGLSIISQYESKLSEFRKRMRQLDPELDARLALWRGLTPVTTIADQTLTKLKQSYGLK